MSKAVLISIQPKWCELIASGKKTVEVRKTAPKLDTPFKVYIYCTKAKEFFSIGGGMYAAADELYRLPTGEIKFGDSFELAADWSGKYDKDNFYNGKVIGEFVCDKIFPISVYYDNPNCELALKEFPYVCLTDKQIIDYLGNGKQGYGWHISDIKIYDKPKELSEFFVIDKDKLKECPYRERIFQNPEFTNGNYLLGGYSCSKIKEPDFDYFDFCSGGCANVFKQLTHQPQNWCYVEELSV